MVPTTGLEITDEKLASLVQEGDKEQFGILVDRYQKKLLRYGRKFLAETSNIEDILQEIFLRAYQNIQSFDTKLKFSSWIYRIAHNLFINALKKQSHQIVYSFNFDTLMPHPIYEDAAVSEREQKELRKMLDSSMNGLPAHYREVIVLYYFEELDYREIADILHIPIGTVGIRLRRAKAQLKKSYLKLHAR